MCLHPECCQMEVQMGHERTQARRRRQRITSGGLTQQSTHPHPAHHDAHKGCAARKLVCLHELMLQGQQRDA